VKYTTLKLWIITALMFAAGDILQASCAVTQDCSAACNNLPCSQSKNFWLPRPFSSDASREITLEKVLFQTDSHREEWNGTFSFATQYGQNFGTKCGCCKGLGSLPFWGASGTNSMTVGNNDGSADLDAYNFSLGNVSVNSDGIGGTITLNPKVTQAGTDFLLYFTHKKDEHGLYFKVHAPVVASIVNPQLCETGTEISGTNTFTDTTTDDTVITYYSNYPNLTDRYTSMTSAFAGGLGDGKSLDSQKSQVWLNFGKIASCKLTDIRLADLSFVLGYNVAANERGFFGVGFKTTCPTGNVPTGKYVLEPIVGRGGLWGVGGDVMGHYKAWKNEDESKYLDVWLQGDVLHLMPGRRPSYRSFDLALNGKGSKYILVQAFKTLANNSTVEAGSVTQAINITTLPVLSKFAVEGSVALMVDYHHNDWNLAVSGEFWGRSKESLSIDMCSCVGAGFKNLNNYAVVGRQVSAMQMTASTGYSTGLPASPATLVALCEPEAKINKSQNVVPLVDGAGALPTFPTTYPTGIKDATVAANRIPADLDVALDICGAAASKAYTGKVFGQFGYTWSECRYTPNFSFIGAAEFTGNTNSAAQMWSAGIQGSLNF
jgi:hypothetical protein